MYWSARVGIISRASLKKPLLGNIANEWPKLFPNRQIRKNIPNFMHSRGNCLIPFCPGIKSRKLPWFNCFPGIQSRKLPWFHFFQEFSRGNCPDSIFSRNSVEETALIPFFQVFSRGNCTDFIFPGIKSRKLPWFHFFQELRGGNRPDYIFYRNSVEETGQPHHG